MELLKIEIIKSMAVDVEMKTQVYVEIHQQLHPPLVYHGIQGKFRIFNDNIIILQHFYK